MGRILAASAIAGATSAAGLAAVSFATHSIWPIFPGVYVVASFVGIHNTSVVAASTVNGIVLFVLFAVILLVYRFGVDRG